MRVFSQFDQKKIIEVASLARDSVDLYVQEIENLEPNDPNLENNILSHPLIMQNELMRQRQDIELLANLDDDMAKSLPVLHEKWFDTKESCLGLTID